VGIPSPGHGTLINGFFRKFFRKPFQSDQCFIHCLPGMTPGYKQSRRQVSHGVFSLPVNLLLRFFRKQTVICFQQDMAAVPICCHGCRTGSARAFFAVSQPVLRLDRDMKPIG